MVRDLFIDTTNNCLILFYEEDNKVIDKYFVTNLTRVSDLASLEIDKFLKKNKTKLSEINNFFVVYGPGTFTGVKVGVTIAKTCKMLNDKIKVYLISSLQLLSGVDNTMSVLDARSNKSYVGVYSEGKAFFPDQILENEMLSEFYDNCKNALNNLKYVDNYDMIKVLNNYLHLKKCIEETKDINLIIPLYIKQYV